MVDGVRDETWVHLKKNIRAAQTPIGKLFSKLSGGFDWGLEHPRGPQMRTTFKETNVNPVEFQHGNQVQRAVVRQQRKSEVSAGEFQFHRFFFDASTSF